MDGFDTTTVAIREEWRPDDAKGKWARKDSGAFPVLAGNALTHQPGKGEHRCGGSGGGTGEAPEPPPPPSSSRDPHQDLHPLRGRATKECSRCRALLQTIRVTFPLLPDPQASLQNPTIFSASTWKGSSTAEAITSALLGRTTPKGFASGRPPDKGATARLLQQHHPMDLR